MAFTVTANFFTLAQQKLERELYLIKKHAFQNLNGVDDPQKHMLLINGCQRSGTTMMLRIFERDMQSRVFGEFSKLSSRDAHKIRLNPLPEVAQMIEQTPARLIVLKPLVETQHLRDILDYFTNAKSVWMYRHYKDVASSNLKNFGDANGLDDLRPIVENRPHDWRSEKVSPEVRKIVRFFFSEEMSSLDAAALFWYVRNQLFFDQQLMDHPRVRLFKYEDLVNQPERQMRNIYDFAEAPFPGESILQQVSTSSVGKGQDINLDPEVTRLCEEMWHKLETSHTTQIAALEQN